MAQDKPQISVLFPVFNSEKYLKSAINSILSQTFRDFELIVVNDGSRDSSLKIIREYKDKRIRLVNCRQNRGLIWSLNTGLKLAKGDYIARQDADDISHRKRFEYQISALKKDPQAVMATSWANIINDQGDLKSRALWSFSPESYYYILTFRNCIAHSSVMFKKTDALKLGGYNPLAIHYEDYDLWAKLKETGNIIQIKKILIDFRINSKGVTSKKSDLMGKGALTVCRNNIFKLTNNKYHGKLIQGLAASPNVEKYTFHQKATLVNELEKIQNRLIAGAPSFLNSDKLKVYASTELAKYYFIKGMSPTSLLEAAGKTGIIPLIKGVFYYWASYRKIHGLYNIFRSHLI